MHLFCTVKVTWPSIHKGKSAGHVAKPTALNYAIVAATNLTGSVRKGNALLYLCAQNVAMNRREDVQATLVAL